MPRHPEIDKNGNAAVVVSVRFAADIIEMLDILTKNRSEYVRQATWEKINSEMKNEYKKNP